MPPIHFPTVLRPDLLRLSRLHTFTPRNAPSHVLRGSAWTVLALAASLASAAQAAVQFVQIPATQAWNTITQVGPVPVLPFDLAPQAAIADLTMGITTIPGLPSPATGSLTVSPAVQKHSIRVSWGGTWNNGDARALIASAGQSLTLTLPLRTTAFHVFSTPANWAPITMTAVTSDGASSGPVVIQLNPPDRPVPGLGFFTSQAGEAIQSIAITTNDTSFGIALFGIAQAPDAPTLSNATPAPGAAQLAFTAPSDTGTHAITGYAGTCTPQGGGTAITVTGASSPLTVSGLANGTAYDCSVAATSDAGTGPASAALPAATPVIAPTAPSLSATPGNAQALFSIGEPADTGGSPITQYALSCSPQGGGAAVTQTVPANGNPTTSTLSGLANGTSYDCSATATNGAGLVSPATAASVTPAAPVSATVAPVPTLGEWSLAALATLAAWLGALGLRRQAR